MVTPVRSVVDISLLKEILQMKRELLVNFIEQSLEEVSTSDNGSIIDVKV